MNKQTGRGLVESARHVQRDWARLPVEERSKALGRLRREMARRRAQLVEIVSAETGKPPLDALAGDILVTLEQARYYEMHASRLLRPRTMGRSLPFYAGTRFEQHYEPHGVVLIYAPANYPLQLTLVPLITALTAGNAVVLKCSDRTPETAKAIRDLCREAHLPEGLVTVLDWGAEEAASLLESGVDMVFFTGSTAVGRRVAARAAELLIPTVMELGGKDAALAFADCHLERALEGVLYGAFSNGGQVCVGVKRLYVEQPIYAEFLERLTARARELRAGTTMDSDMGVLRDDAMRERFRAQVEDALAFGARLHFPGPEWISGDWPVVISNVRPDSRLLKEETFGPALCVEHFHDEDEAVRLANASPWALSASVWTGSTARARRVAAALETGTCAVNDVVRNIGNPHAAFGGNKQSGYGRYHGAQGLYAFSRIKTVMFASDRSKRERNWFPFTRRTYRMLDRLIGLRHRGLPGRWLIAAFVFCLVCGTLGGQTQAEGRLKIVVDPPPQTRGAIGYLIFKSADGFPGKKDKALRGGFVPGAAPGTAVSIDAGSLPPGRYAVSVYQDLNGNRKLDTGWLGIPKEPAGVSNNPRVTMGPPKFDRCAFTLHAGDNTIEIRLVH